MSISAMKQALEALALFASDESDDGQMAISAYESLRQAIEQAEKPDLARVGEVGVWGDKREWVGLTDEEREFFKGIGFVGVDIIEAKLKEKNT